MKNIKNISEMIRNPQIDNMGSTNDYIDAIIIAREKGDRETEKMLIKMLKMQGNHFEGDQLESE
jgi:hypothetical protein